MKQLTVTVRAAHQVAEQFSQLYESEMRAATRRSGEILRDEVQDELLARDLIAEENLFDSIAIFATDDISDRKVAAVGTDDIAGSVAEYGANPTTNPSGMVNVGAIQQWMSAKGISARYGTDEQFAFAIARAIGEEGQPLNGNPKRPFNVAQKRAKRKVERVWAEALLNAAMRASRGK